MPPIRRPPPKLQPIAARVAPPRVTLAAARQTALPVLRRAPAVAAAADSADVRPNPYVDYGHWFTAEGGIAMSYKDIDDRLWHTVRRLFMWLVATAAAYGYIFELSPVRDTATRWVLFAVMAIVNWLIVAKPVELYRTIEIRPDCMIVEGADVFWRGHMELGYPAFQATPEGHQALCGVYGTRFVEYLTVRRFDENDRAPEVFAAHLHAAMQQQWDPLGQNSARRR